MDYGVGPIKTPLLELSVKAEEIWGPALGGRDKEDNLKSVLAVLERHKGIFEAGLNIGDCIKRKDHDALIEEFHKAQKGANDARSIVDTAAKTRRPLTDMEVHQVLVTARMWSDVEDQISTFKRDVWRRLVGTHFSKQAAGEAEKPEEHMELISILLELGVDDNPIWVWLLSRYDYLKNKIANSLDRLRVEVEIVRRGLSNAGKPSASHLPKYLRAAGQDGQVNDASLLDSPKVIEAWEHIYSTTNALLSTQGGLLGEVVEFWETFQSFVDGKAQKSLPVGSEGGSKKHHRLSTDGTKDLNAGALELTNMIRDSISTFFLEPPVEDLSLLLSPIPLSPDMPMSPGSATLSPRGSRFRVDTNVIPPPSPKAGEFWERFAFWPPHANCLSGTYYLGKILVLVGTAASDMASLSMMRKTNRYDELKTLVGGVRERCVNAACASWNQDSENAKTLEDWTRATERHDLTNMPSRFMLLETFELASLQKIMYISEAKRRPDVPDVIVSPPQKLLNVVRTQFFSSIYKILSGMVTIAESPKLSTASDAGNDEFSTYYGESLTYPAGNIDVSSKPVRVLLTLSNIQSIRNELMPHLLATFESTFSITIPDETAKIRDVLGQIDSRLFQAYVKPIAEKIDKIIKEGISDPEWIPKVPRPSDAKPYVYKTLLELVLVHTEVSTTAAPLTAPILKYLLEALSQSLMTAFTAQTRPHYTLGALMQATLDVEFLAQTLNNFTTDRASEIQSRIYVALDERTDNEARLRLQDELQEMRAILRRLREGTKGEL